ncbi:hypothetical protein [Mucilaginibacter sp.]
MKIKALISLIFISTCVSAQIANNQYCDFLSRLHFLNGKANASIKAKLLDFHRYDGSTELVKLKKDRKLSIKIIGGSAVTFIPLNCKDTIDIPISCNWSILKTPLGSTVYLNFEVYKGYKEDYSKDLVIVKNIRRSEIKSRFK